ncbi:hypothetical protein [Arthrobacter sp. AZCC_0090]|uniref:hypothetical protein n=1 Tax=Arthrobacter sp. AZCC_0090 TaxID=2735881 RepID=UPI001615DE68|nr:hypothetical protein [Arthrobacter sp. AZCC_0090]MBB6405980.1 hypothetical protein [Arthrobacter sp. AZCC_0090]
MDEGQARIEFREIDQHGNSLEHHLEPPEAAQRRSSVNPFIIGLWALEFLLVIAIMVIINEAMTPFTPSPGNTMPFAYVLMNMTPQLLQAAALILATLLFWHAWQWQKRKAQK